MVSPQTTHIIVALGLELEVDNPVSLGVAEKEDNQEKLLFGRSTLIASCRCFV